MNINKYYRNKTQRWAGYDYAKPGFYFITVCTRNKTCLFGDIVNNTMYLNEAGKYVKTCWLKIPIYFPNVQIHEFIIMPNHIHGILEITGNIASDKNKFLSEEQQIENVSQDFQKVTPQSISIILRGFKGSVTKWFRNEFVNEGGTTSESLRIWQRSFYDVIIENPKQLAAIRTYIINNPLKWSDDYLNEESNHTI